MTTVTSTLRSHIALAAFGVWTALLPCAPAAAGDPSTWITANQAIDIALQAVPASTAFKVELDVFAGGEVFEAKTFKNNTVFEIRINPDTGQVIDIDDSDGGGAQDKIAEAQFVISQSIFTLPEAIDYALSLFPNYFITEIEMEDRDGLAIFDMDLVRGAYRLEVRMRASDGEIVKQQLKLMGSASGYYDLYIPDAAPNWNLSNLRTPEQIINTAQQAFGGEVFSVELKQQSTNVYRYQVRILKGNKVIFAKYNAKWGTLITSSTTNDVQYVNSVKASTTFATLTLKQAIAKARLAVPNQDSIEAKLRTQDAGHLFEVEFLTSGGILEVKVNSTTGAITEVEFDD